MNVGQLSWLFAIKVPLFLGFVTLKSFSNGHEGEKICLLVCQKVRHPCKARVVWDLSLHLKTDLRAHPLKKSTSTLSKGPNPHQKWGKGLQKV